MTLSFCRNCVTSLPYSSDLGTARARVPLPLFTKWKIRLGWILHLKISLGGEQVFDILCTAWMKSFSTHSEDEEEEKEELIIDASVLRSPLPSLPQDWLTGSYTVCDVF